jgi:hypothetical protein
LLVADLVRIGNVRIGDLDDREGNTEPEVPRFALNKIVVAKSLNRK